MHTHTTKTKEYVHTLAKPVAMGGIEIEKMTQSKLLAL